VSDVHESNDVPLSEHTTLRIGGPARRLVEAEKTDEIVEIAREADATGDPLLILGGGSNLVIPDHGFDGTVLRIATSGLRVVADDDLVEITAAAGESWDSLVGTACAEGWSGIEAMSGIPGLVGATPIQNVGAYGQDVSGSITAVTVYDRKLGAVRTLTPAECQFSYRSSALKGNDRLVVLEVTYTVEASELSQPIRYPELARTLGVDVGVRVPMTELRIGVLYLRRGKGMVLDPTDPDSVSAGSFFTNPIVPSSVAAQLPESAPRWPEGDRVKLSAAWLIEQAGFTRGYGHGNVRISSKHTLALTNRGGASAGELLDLASEIQAGVLKRFGISLVPEPVILP